MTAMVELKENDVKQLIGIRGRIGDGAERAVIDRILSDVFEAAVKEGDEAVRIQEAVMLRRRSEGGDQNSPDDEKNL